jgi:ENTH domain
MSSLSNSRFLTRKPSSIRSITNSEKFGIIMKMIWQNLEVDGKSWKQVFKVIKIINFYYMVLWNEF